MRNIDAVVRLCIAGYQFFLLSESKNRVHVAELGLQKRLACAGKAVIAPAAAFRLVVSDFLDQGEVEKAPNRAVECAGPHAELAVGQHRDLLHHRIAVLLAVRQGKQVQPSTLRPPMHVPCSMDPQNCSPATLASYVDLSKHFAKVGLTGIEMQTVLVVASLENACA